MLVPSKKESRKSSVRPGPAISSANTCAGTTSPPRLLADAKAAWALRLRASLVSQNATRTLLSIAVVMAAQFAEVLYDRLTSGRNAWVADAAVLFPNALLGFRSNPNAVVAALKYNSVSRT